MEKKNTLALCTQQKVENKKDGHVRNEKYDNHPKLRRI